MKTIVTFMKHISRCDSCFKSVDIRKEDNKIITRKKYHNLSCVLQLERKGADHQDRKQYIHFSLPLQHLQTI